MVNQHNRNNHTNSIPHEELRKQKEARLAQEKRDRKRNSSGKSRRHG